MDLNEFEKTCVVSKHTLQYRFHRHLFYITCIFIISLLIPTPVKGLSSSLPKFLDVVNEQARFFALFFFKVRENEMFYNVTQVTKYFKRCGLKKYGKMIRGKQVTLHFKRCRLKKYGKIKCFYNVTHVENK